MSKDIIRCYGTTDEQRRCKLKIHKNRGCFCHIHKPEVILTKENNYSNYDGKKLKFLYYTLNYDIKRIFLVDFLLFLYVFFVYYLFTQILNSTC
jgi:hypothetical protein